MRRLLESKDSKGANEAVPKTFSLIDRAAKWRHHQEEHGCSLQEPPHAATAQAVRGEVVFAPTSKSRSSTPLGMTAFGIGVSSGDSRRQRENHFFHHDAIVGRASAGRDRLRKVFHAFCSFSFEKALTVCSICRAVRATCARRAW